jgi:hypothetical protein
MRDNKVSMLSELRMRNDYTGLTERILSDAASVCDIDISSRYVIRTDAGRYERGLKSQMVTITIVENLHTYQLSKDAWMLGDAKVGTKLVINGEGNTLTTNVFVDWTRYPIMDIIKDLL